jgi:hypothetical protein
MVILDKGIRYGGQVPALPSDKFKVEGSKFKV